MIEGVELIPNLKLSCEGVVPTQFLPSFLLKLKIAMYVIGPQKIIKGPLFPRLPSFPQLTFIFDFSPLLQLQHKIPGLRQEYFNLFFVFDFTLFF